MPSEYSELPGLGPRNNQRVFYIVSLIVLINFFLIIGITSYGASLGYNMHVTLSDVTEIMQQVDGLIPKANMAFSAFERICKNETFLKNYAYICKGM